MNLKAEEITDQIPRNYIYKVRNKNIKQVDFEETQ